MSRSPIGAHMMTAGGLFRAVESGAKVGCEVIQIFTKSPQQWQSRPLTDADVDAFCRVRDETGIPCVAAHDSYLINPAAADPLLLERSRDALADEMLRATRLGIPNVVMHLGARGDASEEEAMERLIESVREVFRRVERRIGEGEVPRPTEPTTLLLETTAGQGTCLGHRFEHLGAVIGTVESEGPIGACLDTCHIFAAGYEIRDPHGYAATMADFDATVGIDRLRLIHANDSKRERGSRVDRHDHIGQGAVGPDGFRNFLNDPRLAGIPIVLETPKVDDMDPVNLAALRALRN